MHGAQVKKITVACSWGFWNLAQRVEAKTSSLQGNQTYLCQELYKGCATPFFVFSGIDYPVSMHRMGRMHTIANVTAREEGEGEIMGKIRTFQVELFNVRCTVCTHY